MDLLLKEKVFLVTAASRGLGYSVAKSLVEEGAKVTICSRNESSLKSATDSLGTGAEYVVADLKVHHDIERLLRLVREKHGHLNGLFVNAGGPPPGRFEDLSDQQWSSAFDLTLMSAVRLTRCALPLLRKADSASILYSTSVSVKQPLDNLLLSNSLRTAVIGMMRTVADEFAPYGVRVNAVCPGYIRTARVDELMAKTKGPSGEEHILSRIPLRRMGHPDEFGRVCAFLMSPLASYIHGALLLIDGGLYRGLM
ncbi:MAG: SDR family oxidoreductase [Candidatus Thorarchaeota archaeon]|nr:SDR family oxidoreductase [Candidatus Thorarchaeota archaeon]